MMEKQCAIYFGNKYVNVNYNTEEEKILIEQFAKKFNMDFNNLLLECGRANPRILLFFLLLKTQVEIIEYKTGKIDLNSAIKQISNFISDVSRKENLFQDNSNEENSESIETNLAIGNLVKYEELNRVKNTIKNKPQLFTENDMENIVDNIFKMFKTKMENI